MSNLNCIFAKNLNDMVLGIIRTSTIYQEIQSQKDELENFIKQDTNEDYIIIGKQGASAIKLDDAYKENLEKVYEYINTGNVTCIYAFALDRIGRNEEVMMKFKNTLIKKKIQLKIMNPTLYLLDSNGMVNSGMEIAFSLFITMAKQEMETKKARFNRGKNRNAKEGKYNGGYIPYGYYVDDAGYFRIKEDEANIIRWIYTTYAEGRMSMNVIWKELNERGIINFSCKNIFFVLNNPCYIGKHQNINYPPIIDEELYLKVREVAKTNNSAQGKSTKVWNFGNKLIVCPECGNHYTGMTDVYRCTGRIRNYNNCQNSVCISIVQLDSLLLKVALFREALNIKNNNSNLEEERKVLIQKIKAHEGILADRVEQKKRNIIEMYADAVISKEEYKERLAKVTTENKELVNKLNKLKNDLQNLDNRLEGGDIYEVQFKKWLANGISEDAKTLYDLVHRNISKVEITKVEKHYVVTIDGKDEYIYYPHRANHWDGIDVPVIVREGTKIIVPKQYIKMYKAIIMPNDANPLYGASQEEIEEYFRHIK